MCPAPAYCFCTFVLSDTKKYFNFFHMIKNISIFLHRTSKSTATAGRSRTRAFSSDVVVIISSLLASSQTSCDVSSIRPSVRLSVVLTGLAIQYYLVVQSTQRHKNSLRTALKPQFLFRERSQIVLGDLLHAQFQVRLELSHIVAAQCTKFKI